MPHTLNRDNGRDEALERLTRLVRTILGVDIAAVSLIDGETQRFKSVNGLEIAEIPLPQSFCRAPWREGRTIIIPDATKDEEFHNHPLVTEMKLKAYAGVPLKSSAGETFGTICAIHKSTREFDARDITVLEDLARIAETELELREHVNTDSLTGALTRRAFVRESSRLAELVRRKRLQSAISALRFTFRGQEVSVTASFGLSELGSDVSIDAALQRADAALYKAKDAGRNRVVVTAVESETAA